MYTCSIQSFKILASFCSWADWFECYLVKIAEDLFSRYVAQFYTTVKVLSFGTDGQEETVHTMIRVYTVCHSFYIIWTQSSNVKTIILSRLMTKPTKGSVSSKDSDQPGHPPSLIRVFAVRMKKHWVLSYPLSALWSLWSGLGGIPGWSETSLGA